MPPAKRRTNEILIARRNLLMVPVVAEGDSISKMKIRTYLLSESNQRRASLFYYLTMAALEISIHSRHGLAFQVSTIMCTNIQSVILNIAPIQRHFHFRIWFLVINQLRHQLPCSTYFNFQKQIRISMYKKVGTKQEQQELSYKFSNWF